MSLPNGNYWILSAIDNERIGRVRNETPNGYPKPIVTHTSDCGSAVWQFEVQPDGLFVLKAKGVIVGADTSGNYPVNTFVSSDPDLNEITTKWAIQLLPSSSGDLGRSGYIVDPQSNMAWTAPCSEPEYSYAVTVKPFNVNNQEQKFFFTMPILD
ncbi:hypothetical protein NP233_g11573 [Leucocoprinus birnbaumii]|uniref:Uncharacterized protein n=1 Tax=Leucocoprinus birnbaumii TaxID=56174 RepID=A0AAD5VGA4_9AGAR|nr:hypothetical protein NP233_g11573 [Leucocoprinus birnbaumii]